MAEYITITDARRIVDACGGTYTQAETESRFGEGYTAALIAADEALARAETDEEPNPDYEAKAAAFRAEDRIEIDISEASVTVAMLETWFPVMFPANELGQVPMARCMAESAADMIRALVSALEASVSTPSQMGEN